MASNEIEVLDAAATVEKLKKTVSRRALNRRNFMAALGVTGAASGAALLSRRSNNPKTVLAAGPTQTDILNFALNLEYLEATFYSYVTQGADLPAATGITQGSGVITGFSGQINTKGVFTGTAVKTTFPNQQITDLMNELYYDELNHVITLRNLLGTAAVARPALNLVSVGAPATGVTYTFPTLTSAQALGISRLLEDVGVTAYTAAAALLTGANLTYAAQILAVEGFHAGALRLLQIQLADPYDPAENFIITGVLTSGSMTVTSVSTTIGLVVGATITAVAGVAAGTTITAFTTSAPAGSNTITLSANATAATAAGSTTIFEVGIPADSLDVKPVDLGATASSGPSAITGTSNPTVTQGFFATSGSVTANVGTPAGTAFARTTSQVLAILYGTVGTPAAIAATTNVGVLAGDPAPTGTAKGGFFPSGVNGNITTI